MPETFGEQLNNEAEQEPQMENTEEKPENLGDENVERANNPEEEQSVEEIRETLERALNEGSSVDVLVDSAWVRSLYVDEIDGEYLMMTYLDETGQPGEGIPLEMSRIKGAKFS